MLVVFGYGTGNCGMIDESLIPVSGRRFTDGIAQSFCRSDYPIWLINSVRVKNGTNIDVAISGTKEFGDRLFGTTSPGRCGTQNSKQAVYMFLQTNN
jgi:hypothetical protein